MTSYDDKSNETGEGTINHKHYASLECQKLSSSCLKKGHFDRRTC